MNQSVSLSLSRDYVSHWSVREACREILQNCLDCQDHEILFDQDNGTVVFTTIDGAIPRSALLLGESGKKSGKTIGHFGEGLKLALLILSREGYDVEIANGNELWVPEMKYSDEFETQCLHINIYDFPEGDCESVKISVAGLSDEQLDNIRSQYIKEDQYKEAVADNGHGCQIFEPSTLSTEEDYSASCDGMLEPPRKVYCGGLFVCDLPKGFRYSYNFAPGRLNLDRDRKTVQNFDLTWEIARLMVETSNAEMIVDLTKDGAKDVENYCETHTSHYSSGSYVAGGASFPARLKEAAKVSFVERNGEKAIPISINMDAAKKNFISKEALLKGYTPVVVTQKEFDMLGDSIVIPEDIVAPARPEVSDRLEQFLEKHGNDLTSEAYDDILGLYDELTTYENFMRGDS